MTLGPLRARSERTREAAAAVYSSIDRLLEKLPASFRPASLLRYVVDLSRILASELVPDLGRKSILSLSLSLSLSLPLFFWRFDELLYLFRFQCWSRLVRARAIASIRLDLP